MVQRSRSHVWIGMGFVGFAVAIAGAVYLGIRLSNGAEAQAVPTMPTEAAVSLDQQPAIQSGEQARSVDQYAGDADLPGPNRRAEPVGGDSYRTLLDAERAARQAQEAANATAAEATDAAEAAAVAQTEAARSDKTGE